MTPLFVIFPLLHAESLCHSMCSACTACTRPLSPMWCCVACYAEPDACWVVVPQDVQYTVINSQDKKSKISLLQGVSGYLNSGEMSALVSVRPRCRSWMASRLLHCVRWTKNCTASKITTFPNERIAFWLLCSPLCTFWTVTWYETLY